MVYTSQYPYCYVTADVVAFSIRGGDLSVLLVQRGNAPYQGCWALPGGFVDQDEDLEPAAARELQEETSVADARLEQLGAYGAPHRDPRHRVVSVAWLAVLGPDVEPTAGDDASHAEWRSVSSLTGDALAFDHDTILRDGLDRLRANLERTNQACAFLAEEFTIAELRAVYEAVWGRPLDAANFQRKVTRTAGLVEPTGRRRTFARRGRPGELFTAGAAREVWPPMRP